MGVEKYIDDLNKAQRDPKSKSTTVFLLRQKDKKLATH